MARLTDEMLEKLKRIHALFDDPEEALPVTTTLIAEIDRLRAENRELREALRPFSRAADDPKLHMLVLSHSFPDVSRDDDLRRAKALLEKEG